MVARLAARCIPLSSVFLLPFLTLAVATPAASQVAVTTYHNDNGRTGQNLQETILTPANVNVNSFGKLFSYPLPKNSYVYAQPLYLPNVQVPNQGPHNVVYVATEHDVLYAFDGDGKTTTPLWTADLAASVGGTPVPALEVHGD